MHYLAFSVSTVTLPTITPGDPDRWKQKRLTYIWWIDIDGNPLVEDQNHQVTKDTEQKENLRKRENNLQEYTNMIKETIHSMQIRYEHAWCAVACLKYMFKNIPVMQHFWVVYHHFYSLAVGAQISLQASVYI